MIGEQFQQLKEYLQQFKHQDAEIQRQADGSYLITIKGFDLPEGWNPKKVDILFVAPPGYPAAKPDCFWVSPAIRLANGAIPQAANEGTPLPYDMTPGRPLTWFSWHLQTWDPNRDRLEQFYRVILQRLDPPR